MSSVTFIRPTNLDATPIATTKLSSAPLHWILARALTAILLIGVTFVTFSLMNGSDCLVPGFGTSTAASGDDGSYGMTMEQLNTRMLAFEKKELEHANVMYHVSRVLNFQARFSM